MKIRGLDVLVGLSVAVMQGFVAQAHPAMPTDAPIDRVVANLEAKIKANPSDADALYSLGRAHSIVYATKNKIIKGYEREENFSPISPDNALKDFDPPKKDPKNTPSQAELQAHLQQGVNALVKALQLKRSDRYYLALASAIETAGDDIVGVDVAEAFSIVPERGFVIGGGQPPHQEITDSYVLSLPEKRAGEVVRNRIFMYSLDVAGRELKRNGTLMDVWNCRDDKDAGRKKEARVILREFWQALLEDTYFTAFALALADEAKMDSRPVFSAGLRISLEAAQGFKRVHKDKKDPDLHDARPAIVDTAIAELSKQHESGGITPVIFSLDPAASVQSLLADHTTVDFHLDGTHLKQSWSWVKPTTGILVWDPAGAGQITSGKQLFGSVTWWVMFRDGYQALDSLDDDRDGWIRGEEMKGIKVWFDRNSNGVSDAGEVVSLEELKIDAIGVKADGTEDGFEVLEAGVKCSDGRVLRTVDWVARRRD